MCAQGRWCRVGGGGVRVCPQEVNKSEKSMDSQFSTHFVLPGTGRVDEFLFSGTHK